jgi:translocation and assembly module TamB
VTPTKISIEAELKNVALDTILDDAAPRPFQRLGFDAGLSGAARAEWTNGELRHTLTVGANLSVNPTGRAVPEEVPVVGTVDAVYTHRDGAVDLHRLDVHTPASQVEAHGKLGAHPIASATEMAVEFHSQNLGEFDTVLRILGLSRHGKTGAAALPVTLAGRVDFLHGTWGGSLVDPRIAGNLKATQLAIEMPPKPGDKSETPMFVNWDTVEAAGAGIGSRTRWRAILR